MDHMKDFGVAGPGKHQLKKVIQHNPGFKPIYAILTKTNS